MSAGGREGEGSAVHIRAGRRAGAEYGVNSGNSCSIKVAIGGAEDYFIDGRRMNGGLTTPSPSSTNDRTYSKPVSTRLPAGSIVFNLFRPRPAWAGVACSLSRAQSAAWTAPADAGRCPGGIRRKAFTNTTIWSAPVLAAYSQPAASDSGRLEDAWLGRTTLVPVGAGCSGCTLETSGVRIGLVAVAQARDAQGNFCAV